MATFDWKVHIEEIEECAKKNKLLEIDIPEEEWKRLWDENIKSLKSLLSHDAARRLVLLDSNEPKRYYLLVARICSRYN